MIFKCLACTREFATKKGVSQHHTRAHGHRLFTWNAGIVVDEDDGKQYVAFQFGYGLSPATVDIEPSYARRIAQALLRWADEADDEEARECPST